MSRITYGPFSVRIDLLAGPLISIVVAPLLICLGGSFTRIQCERSTGLSCRMWTWYFTVDDHTFTPASARTTHSQHTYKGRTTDHGRVVILDDRSREHISVEVDYAESRQRAAELQAFLQNPHSKELSFTLHDSWLILGLGILMAIVGAVMGRAALRGAGRVHLDFSEDRRELVARRTFWGIPLSTRHIDILGAKAVTIEWKAQRQPLSKTYTPPETTGRVCVQTPRGIQPLLGTFPRGRNIHLAMAKELRMLLGLPPADDEAPAPTPSYDWSSFGGRFAACWAGTCVGALAGIALGSVGALTLGGQKMPDGAGGVWYFGGLAMGVAGGIAAALYLTRKSRLER
jgi:hypothetical protein